MLPSIRFSATIAATAVRRWRPDTVADASTRAASAVCSRPSPLCRSFSSSSSSSSPPPDVLNVDALRADLCSRPATAVYDVLSPTNSHLLNVALADFLPAGAGPVDFATAAAATAATTTTPADPTHRIDPFCLPSAASTDPLPQPLPAGHHLVYFPLQAPASLLLPDGTDPTPWPGPPFVRRMWAGGAVHFRAPQQHLLLDNRRAVCVERVGGGSSQRRSSDDNSGDSGIKVTGPPGREKVFVDVWRRYGPVPDLGRDCLVQGSPGQGQSQQRRYAPFEAAVEADPAIEERRTLVFMREDTDTPPAASTTSRIVRSPHAPDDAFRLTPSPTLLFHFSALTFNAHAIHLDPDYCRRVEGHRNVLVHGPLLLVLMLSAVRKQARTTIRSIEYRNLAPLYAGEPLRVCIRRNPNASRAADAAGTDAVTWDVWVEGPDGGLAVRGVAVTGSQEG